MAIDLSCYAGNSVMEVTKTLDAIRKTHFALFDENFLISHVWACNAVNKEIAMEYGLKAECEFLVSLNVKEFSIFMPTVVFLLKHSFESDKLVILYLNETLM